MLSTLFKIEKSRKNRKTERITGNIWIALNYSWTYKWIINLRAKVFRLKSKWNVCVCVTKWLKKKMSTSVADYYFPATKFKIIGSFFTTRWINGVLSKSNLLLSCNRIRNKFLRITLQSCIKALRMREFVARPKCNIHFLYIEAVFISFQFVTRFADWIVFVTLKESPPYAAATQHLFAFNLFDDISICSFKCLLFFVSSLHFLCVHFVNKLLRPINFSRWALNGCGPLHMNYIYGVNKICAFRS